MSPDGGKKKSGDAEAKIRRSNPTMERMRELLKTDEAKTLYKQRKTIVEPVLRADQGSNGESGNFDYAESRRRRLNGS
ncbi:MAG: hypothetical protein U5J83_05020 [Bryobacterales bacterium]|nr:hypothetical protein [Bryobacterales bacterium]